jgi:catalase
MVIPDGEAAVGAWVQDAHVLDFIRQQYRHCKPILAVGSGRTLLDKADIPPSLVDGSVDPGLVDTSSDTLAEAISKFKAALASHRSFGRESDPPKV